MRYLTEIKDGSSEVARELMENPEIREAVECLQESAFNKGEMEYYDRYWDQVRVERTLMVDMKEMGLKKGLARGKEKGIKEGIKEGACNDISGSSTARAEQGNKKGICH